MDALAKDPEYRVPFDRLRQAAKIYEHCPAEKSDDMDPKVKSVSLAHNLAKAFPSWVAHRAEKARDDQQDARWYAGACRVRGENVPKHYVGHPWMLLVAPRVAPHPNKADAWMPNLKARVLIPLEQMADDGWKPLNAIWLRACTAPWPAHGKCGEPPRVRGYPRSPCQTRRRWPPRSRGRPEGHCGEGG